MPDKPHAIERHTPMIGRPAAEARARAERAQVVFGIGMLIFIALLITAAASHARPIAIVAYVSLTLPFGAMLARFWLRHSYRRIVSAALGVQIERFLDVPLIPEKYEEWCLKHGITPYSIQDRGT